MTTYKNFSYNGDGGPLQGPISLLGCHFFTFAKRTYERKENKPEGSHQEDLQVAAWKSGPQNDELYSGHSRPYDPPRRRMWAMLPRSRPRAMLRFSRQEYYVNQLATRVRHSSTRTSRGLQRPSRLLDSIMRFVNHRDLEGKHAFLGASKSTWLRYDDDKVIKTYRNARQLLLVLSSMRLLLGIFVWGFLSGDHRLLSGCSSMMRSVWRAPEQVLYFSPTLSGTADAISFDLTLNCCVSTISRPDTARPSRAARDLSRFAVLPGYNVALIGMHLRIYQNSEVRLHITRTLMILERSCAASFISRIF